MQFCAALFIPILITAQVPKAVSVDLANHYLSSRGEVILRFVKPVKINLDELSTFLSIDNLQNDTITAYANEAGFRRFLNSEIPFEVVNPPSLKGDVFSSRKKAVTEWQDHYPDYAEYLNLMEEFASVYPNLCRLTQFGTSINGRKLLALKISDNPGTDETEPVILYSSTMHGDETLGYNLMLRLIHHLLVSYDSDAQVRQLIDQIEIWINPLANPDGSFFLSDTSVAGAIRFNARQTDLNRDFPDIRFDNWENNQRQPETTAMMDFMKSLGLVLSANFHGGAEVVNYPWDTWSYPHADHDWYRNISRAYADTVHVYGPPDYMDDLDNGITNGYAWYSVYGGRQDYANFILHAREVTIELSTDKMPAESSLGEYWDYNKRSLLQLIANALSGISGVITDSITGQPVGATIRLAHHDYDSSFVLSDAINGTFYRLTGGGEFDVVFSAQGYATKRIPVVATGGDFTHLDVKLVPLNQPGLYPNPFTNLLSVYIDGSGETLILELYDLSGRRVRRIVQNVLSPGRQEIEVTGLAPGVYIVNLLYGSQAIKQVMVKSRF